MIEKGPDEKFDHHALYKKLRETTQEQLKDVELQLETVRTKISNLCARRDKGEITSEKFNEQNVPLVTEGWRLTQQKNSFLELLSRKEGQS
ncbi:MAG: hypothetical protein HY226_04390 [Candidatus Vogelbacteria bacterium]|nr:hypothetical protein [Candidatus Vogelbacteria bacterium]